MFNDRMDAASQLGTKLAQYLGQYPLILAIPRGGVPIGKYLADTLHGELDVVLVRKIAHPLLPEYALGAVDESGWTYYSPFADAVVPHGENLDVERLRQLDLIRQRRARYTPTHTGLDPAGRVVIVVDDGVATGATMLTALHELRSKHAARLICAIPVASNDALRLIRPEVDELVCLSVPLHLDAISLHYQHFPQVSDEEVVKCLQGHRSSGQEIHREH